MASDGDRTDPKVISAQSRLDAGRCQQLPTHLSHEVSPILATAIRNCAGGRGKAFLDGVVLLQVGDPKAFEALRRNERIRPFLKGVLAPGSFVVTEEGRKEATKLLRDLGFSLDAECKLASLDD